MSQDSIEVVSQNTLSQEKGEVVSETKSVSAAEEIKATDETKEASDASKEVADDTQKAIDGQDEEDLLAAEDDDEESKEQDSKEGKPKKSGFKKRIEKLNERASLEAREKELAQKEAEYWKQKALSSEKVQEPQQKDEVLAQDFSAKPNAENFDTHEEYVEALTDWKIEQKEQERITKAKEDEFKTSYQKSVETFQSSVQAFKESHDDFEDVIESVNDVPMSIGIQEALLTSEDGPALMYELAKNRETYERINKMNPLAAAREIGKIEARLTQSSPQEKTVEKKLTKTPAPINPVGSKGVTASKSLNDLSYEDYKRVRMEQMQRG